jgi:hypothetical protein
MVRENAGMTAWWITLARRREKDKRLGWSGVKTVNGDW